METQPILGGVSLAQKQLHFLHVGTGDKAQASLLGRIADRLVAQHLQHCGKFQRADGFFKHFAHKYLFSHSIPPAGRMAL